MSHTSYPNFIRDVDAFGKAPETRLVAFCAKHALTPERRYITRGGYSGPAMRVRATDAQGQPVRLWYDALRGPRWRRA